MSPDEQKEFSERLQKQLNQISGMYGPSSYYLGYRGGPVYKNGTEGEEAKPIPEVELRRPEVNLEAAFNAKHGQHFIDNMDFEFVSWTLIYLVSIN